MMETIEELTSSKYNGRLTGTEGNYRATEYLRQKFSELGLECMDESEGYLDVYNQKVINMVGLPLLKVVDKDGNTVERLKYLDDFVVLSNPEFQVNVNETHEVISVESMEEFFQRGSELKNRVLLAGAEVYRSKEFKESLMNGEVDVAGMVLVLGNEEEDREFKKNVYLAQPEEDFTEEFIKENMDKPFRIFCDEDYIIICGHFDHLGENFNGTDNPGASDNATGVATFLEVARIMKDNDMKLANPVMFIAFNGEENGLYGSTDFCKNSGVDMSRVKMINVDMIANLADGPVTIGYVKESQLSKDIKGIAEDMNMIYAEEKYSDHYSAVMAGADAICLVEIEQSEYHTFKDNIEVIDESDLQEAVELILRYLLKFEK